MSGDRGTTRQGRGRRRSAGRDVDGILLLDKPTGITSNAALQTAKRCFEARKAGHTGSLDPLASGMLPLCFGQATKVSGMLLDADKVYEVEAVVGAQTDTADADGTVVAVAEKTALTESELRAAMQTHIGTIEQVPPMYSALKHQGRRLHELARQGIEVERAPRTVHIRALELLHFDPHRPRLRVHCSKGTYIRTLVETLAQAAGTLAHVGMLRRLWVEPFAGQPMVTLDALQEGAGDPSRLDTLLLGADVALARFPALRLNAALSAALCNGRPLEAAQLGAQPLAEEYCGLLRAYDPSGTFLGVAERLDDRRVVARRLFVAGA
ncbi:MAG: tRNA pseudouridine(55) synthase TruB [Gammaproteobacteria bacterium]|jgi:tRNA pseudouridine55 synthase|nr:tRNA pseudouridine(55) synthase TruB [Gammaproteobacteria bacterium]